MNTHLENTVMKEAMYNIEARKLIIKKLRPQYFYNTDNKDLFRFLQKEWIQDINQTLEVLMPKVIKKGLTNIFIDTEQFPLSGDIDKNIDYIIKQHLDYEFKLAIEQNDGLKAIKITEEKKKLFKSVVSEDSIYLKEDIEDQIKSASKEGLNLEMFKTGIYGLSNYFKIIKKQTTIITGVPSAGKSNFVDDIAVNLAKKYDWKTLHFSPENQPIKLHLMNIAKKYCGEPVMGTGKEIESKWITDHFTFINTNLMDHDLDLLLLLAGQQKPDLLVIDPWNEINVTSEPETRFISESLSKIKSFTYRKNTHVFIVAHPTKLRKAESGKYRGQYPPASSYDINGSAMWYNKPDNILSIWRGVDNSNELHIQKIKFEHVTGERGMLELKYDIDTGSYTGVSINYANRIL